MPSEALRGHPRHSGAPAWVVGWAGAMTREDISRGERIAEDPWSCNTAPGSDCALCALLYGNKSRMQVGGSRGASPPFAGLFHRQWLETTIDTEHINTVGRNSPPIHTKYSSLVNT